MTGGSVNRQLVRARLGCLGSRENIEKECRPDFSAALPISLCGTGVNLITFEMMPWLWLASDLFGIHLKKRFR